ncbi:hypothetical protein EJB05_16214, partial [Eragrostis curvula]
MASSTQRWRELQGEHSWDGLLDPLDIDLRRSIIGYGELAQATYDAFNTEQRSPHAGACMYGYDDLLEKTGVAAGGHYKLYKDEDTSITVTGHSLGAALSTLNAVDMVASGVSAPANSSMPPCLVTAMVLACPHVGNDFFKGSYNSFRNLKSLHIKNLGDVVPLVPPQPYVDVHVPLSINTGRSPHLKISPETLHNLELYLHGVAGEQGSAGGFKLEVDRDLALVNKGIDLLKDEYPVPANWWVTQYKSLVKNDEGKYELRDFEQI